MFQTFIDQGRDLNALEQMVSSDIAAAIESFLCSYVYNRWLAELGKSIEKGAVSASDAVRLEREVRGFVRNLVHFDLSGIDVVRIDWNGAAGAAIVERVFTEAYSLIGGEA